MEIDKHIDTIIDIAYDNRKFRSKMYILKRLSNEYDSVDDVLYDVLYHYTNSGYGNSFDSEKGPLTNYVFYRANGILSNLITAKQNRNRGKSRSVDIYDKLDKVEFDEEIHYPADNPNREIRRAFLNFARSQGRLPEAMSYLGRGNKYSELALELGVSETVLRQRIHRLVEDFKARCAA